MTAAHERKVSPDDELMHLAYAEAAVMLLECLMVKLVERGVLNMDELIETIETSLEAKRSMVHDKVHPEIAVVAAGVLTRLANSLRATTPRRE
jgi:hypothetical protein